MAFKEIDIKDLEFNPFQKIGSEWALVTAGDETASNTMTVSWGALGVVWGRNAVTVYVRPQRFTKQFVDAAERFTLSFYGAGHKRELTVLGSKSGRDGDKVAEVGFTPAYLGASVAYEQAELVFVCRKLYADDIRPERFVDASVDEEVYPEHDYHTMYIGEVEKVFVRDDA